MQMGVGRATLLQDTVTTHYQPSAWHRCVVAPLFPAVWGALARCSAVWCLIVALAAFVYGTLFATLFLFVRARPELNRYQHGNHCQAYGGDVDGDGVERGWGSSQGWASAEEPDVAWLYRDV